MPMIDFQVGGSRRIFLLHNIISYHKYNGTVPEYKDRLVVTTVDGQETITDENFDTYIHRLVGGSIVRP